MSRQPTFLRERLNAVRQNGTFCLWTLGLIFGLWAGDESLICLRQQSREQVRPLALTSFVRDKVLADFNRNVMQAASLTMHRNRVIRRIGHAVRRVVADDKPLLAFQQRHEEMRE